MRDSGDTPAIGNKAILTVALCCLVAMMEGIDLQAPGLTIPVLGPLFKLSPADKGLFLSISTFGLMFGAAIGGSLSDRIGRKWVLIVAAALFGLFSLLNAFSTSAQMLLAMRFLTGLGLGGALPNVIALAAENVSFARRHTAVGFLYASMPVGGGLASLIVANASAPAQWPVVYVVGGVAPLVLVPLLALILPNRKPAPAAAAAQTIKKPDGILKALFGEGRAARTLLLWLGFFTALMIMYSMLGWLPSLMVERGLSRNQASTVQVAFNWFGAVGSIVTGLMLDRGRRGVTVAVVFALTGAALVYLAKAPGDLGLSILAGGLIGLTISATQTVLYSLAPSCYTLRVRGTGVGWAVAVGRLGSAAGPLLGGVLVGIGLTLDKLVVIALIPVLVVSAIASVFVAVMAQTKADLDDTPVA